MDSVTQSWKKVFRCIDTSETLDQLETSRKLANNFFRLYDINPLNKCEVQSRIDDKYKELSEGMYG